MFIQGACLIRCGSAHLAFEEKLIRRLIFIQKKMPELLHNWNARVTATVPEDKLLVMELKQGWEPLCGFLGLPVPDEPLPRANDAAAAGEAYREILDRVREIWLNGFAVAGVMGFAAWKTWAVSRQ